MNEKSTFIDYCEKDFSTDMKHILEEDFMKLDRSLEPFPGLFPEGELCCSCCGRPASTLEPFGDDHWYIEMWRDRHLPLALVASEKPQLRADSVGDCVLVEDDWNLNFDTQCRDCVRFRWEGYLIWRLARFREWLPPPLSYRGIFVRRDGLAEYFDEAVRSLLSLPAGRKLLDVVGWEERISRASDHSRTAAETPKNML